MQFSRICCNRSAVTFIFQLPRERNGEIVFLQVPADPRVRALKGQKGKSRTNAIAQQTSGDRTAIRPFQVDVPEAKIVKLRSRIDATEWPDPETVADESQGMQLATMQELARYWATDYDWRKCEAKLNSWPNFMTEIDGLDIHFIHVRSQHENALPLIVTTCSTTSRFTG
jgi:hypothetical protein